MEGETNKYIKGRNNSQVQNIQTYGSFSTPNVEKIQDSPRQTCYEDIYLEKQFQVFLQQCQGQILEKDLSNNELENEFESPLKMDQLIYDQKNQHQNSQLKNEIDLVSQEEVQQDIYQFSLQTQSPTLQSLKDLNLNQLHFKPICNDFSHFKDQAKIGVDTPQFTYNKDKSEDQQHEVPYFISEVNKKEKNTKFESNQIIEEEDLNYFLQEHGIKEPNEAQSSLDNNRIQNQERQKSFSESPHLLHASQQESSQTDSTKKKIVEDKVSDLQISVDQMKKKNVEIQIQILKKKGYNFNLEEYKCKIKRLNFQIQEYDQQFLQQKKDFKATQQQIKALNSDIEYINDLLSKQKPNSQNSYAPTCLKMKQVKNMYRLIQNIQQSDEMDIFEEKGKILRIKNKINKQKIKQQEQTNQHLQMILQLNNRIQQKDEIIQKLKNSNKKIKKSMEEDWYFQDQFQMQEQQQLQIKVTSSISPQKDNTKSVTQNRSRQTSPFRTNSEVESYSAPRSQFLKELEEKSIHLNQALNNIMSTRSSFKHSNSQTQRSDIDVYTSKNQGRFNIQDQFMSTTKSSDLKRERGSSLTIGTKNLEQRLHKIDNMLESSRNKFNKTSLRNQKETLQIYL